MSEHGFFQITQKLFLRDGEKLLIMRDKKSGFGDLPGGRMSEAEFFEDWLLSMDRELKEELGENVNIQIETKPIFFHKHRVTEGNHPCIIIAYKAKLISGEIQLSEEHDYLEWVNVGNYEPANFFSDYMLDAVRLYLKNYV